MKVPEGAGNTLRHRHDGTPAQSINPQRFAGKSYQVSQRSVGPYRGGSRPDRTGTQIPAGRGVLRRLRAAHDRLEDSAVGDAIGVVALFALLWIGLLAGSVLEGL